MRSELTPESLYRKGLCIGCGACGARMELDRFGEFRPQGTALPDFAERCPFSGLSRNEDELAAPLFGTLEKDSRLGYFAALAAGYAPAFRASGSSGGLASFVLSELLASGMIDAAVHVGRADPEKGHPLFSYRISRDHADIRAGAQSRYYPVELSRVLNEIRAQPGRYALVGVPCFIRAVRLAMRLEPVLADRIVATIGLVCGHGKSARLAESFALQLGINAPAVAAVDFRVKDPARPANWYRARIAARSGVQAEGDWWHFADGDWGAGFFQNRACDACDDVMAETADLTLGDAWVAPYAEDGRGTNIVIARAPWAVALLQRATGRGDAVLTTVDADLIAGTQLAGLRHRREGMAFRLAVDRRLRGMKKRVLPATSGLSLRRRLIYRTRALIARHSRLVFCAARQAGLPALYLLWARPMLRIYQALAYSRGWLGRLADRWLGPAR